MNRLKLFATATLMALAFTACDEGTPPPVEPPPPPTPVGTISGAVTIEGTAASGITATLSSGATTTTGSGGNFAFSGVEAGTYTVTISGFPEDATFAEVTQSATIATDGQNVQLTFAGEYIRSSAVVGNVVAADAMMSGGDGQPETLAGVTVTLGGEFAMGETMETDETGGFAFTGLRAGTYTVTISDFPEDVSFETVSVEIEVDVGDVGQADFTGHFIRTSAVEGQVIIEGEGLAGITVTLSGGPADESFTKMTDADGLFRFEDLRPGDYTVEIADFDPRDYEFAATSADVSVDLDETGTVSFTGVLLRTSGISGRVSVAGMGLGDITVTLSGAADDTTMTDPSGQYAFAGLAAGDYTVTIAVESNAYVFESMSQDRTVGDDESAIVNFEGAHDMSASLTAMLFIDEASKNDTYDEGDEDAFPSTAMLAALQAAEVQLPPMLPVPVTLVGPVVNQMRSGVLNLATGQISFSGLRAGTYQLRVGSLAALLPALPAAAAAVLQDYEYGGPTGGYEIEVGVGDQATQAIPVDITHQTVNFAVTLKAGEARGMPVSGASVTLSSGDNSVGSGATADNGVASIRFARAGVSMVSAGVAVEGYHVAEGMTDVEWDPKSPHTQATNANDIVNLNANFSFNGATVTTPLGGGAALAGWAISVTSGDDAVADAPEALNAEGMESFSETVGAGDLPKTYTIAVADDQEGEDADGNELDGGENYEATELTYVHDGLMLAGADATEAGTLVVTYTTQTLNVFVHEENDQVMGYTGNVLGGDVRMSGMLDVELRYVQNGYRHQFSAADSIKSGGKDGVYTFSNVPADKNVIVTADKASDTLDIIVLDPDEVAAEAFGAQGGFHHTVNLCSQGPVEGQQRHDECATFAYVNTYAVDGQAWKNVVEMAGDDFAANVDGSQKVSTVGEPGLTVSLAPVEGENLINEGDSFEAEKAGDKAFDFGQRAAGVYTLEVSDDNWVAMRGPADDPSDDLEEHLSPLGSALNIDVTPKTGYVYGTVTDDQGRRAAGVAVDVNGESAVTDAQGRYVVEGFDAMDYRKPGASKATEDQSVVKVQDPGAGAMVVVANFKFAANSPKRQNITVAQATDIAMFSGSVTHSGTGAGVSGVKILVDYGAGPVNPLNAETREEPKPGGGKRAVTELLTGADGSYTANVRATGGTVTISAEKEFMFFTPGVQRVSAVVGTNVRGINFSAFDNGTITGRVLDAADNTKALSGVVVEAWPTGADREADGAKATHADTTGATGTYVLRAPYGSYSVVATKNGYTFDEIANVSVPNDGRPIDNIMGTADNANADLGTLNLSGVTLQYPDPADATKTKSGFMATETAYTATVGNAVAMTTVTAIPAVAGASASIDPDDADGSAGNGHQVELVLGANEITVTVTSADGSATQDYEVTVTRRAPSTMIEGTVTDASGAGLKDVVITVDGSAPLNASGTPKALKTDADGKYSAEVESGGTAMVRPSMDGYTFSPAERSVTLTPNATITGIDFEGSGNASIRGRVVDENGASLSGAVVTASPRGGTGGPSATTRSSGIFTIRNVPLGWRTLTVQKAGYSFAPRDVFVTGGTIDIGNLAAGGTIQPTSVGVERVEDGATRTFDGNVTVTWAAGGTPLAAGTYQAQSCVPAFVDDPSTTERDETVCDNAAANAANWNNLGATVAFDATSLSVTAASVSDGVFMVRVQANDGSNPAVNSDMKRVAAIEARPSIVSAERDINTAPDDLLVRWNGDRDADTEVRIIGSFDFAGTTKWVVLNAVDFAAAGYTAGGTTATEPDHTLRVALPADNATDADAFVAAAAVVEFADDGTITITATTEAVTNEMAKTGFGVRVLARQPGVDYAENDDPPNGDDGDDTEDVWKASVSQTIDPK